MSPHPKPVKRAKPRKPAPRIRFCWECGKKLRANFYREVMVQDIPRIVHAACAKPAERL